VLLDKGVIKKMGLMKTNVDSYGCPSIKKDWLVHTFFNVPKTLVKK